MKGGVRGKYASAFDKTAVTVLLDPDVAKIFPDDGFGETVAEVHWH